MLVQIPLPEVDAHRHEPMNETHVLERIYRVRASGPALVLGVLKRHRKPVRIDANVVHTLIALVNASRLTAHLTLHVPGEYLIEAIRIYDHPLDLSTTLGELCISQPVGAPVFIGRVLSGYHIAQGTATLVPDPVPVSHASWVALPPHWPAACPSSLVAPTSCTAVEQRFRDSVHMYDCCDGGMPGIVHVWTRRQECGGLGASSRSGANPLLSYAEHATSRDALDMYNVPLRGYAWARVLQGGVHQLVDTGLLWSTPRLCIAGGSHARNMAGLIRGSIWFIHRYIGLPFANLHKCSGLVLHWGQWDLSWANAKFLQKATLLEHIERLDAHLERSLAYLLTTRSFSPRTLWILPASHNPLNCIITSCPPADWRSPTLIDIYNERAKQAAHRWGVTFVETRDIIEPMWDASVDFSHPTGAVLRALVHRLVTNVCNSSVGASPGFQCVDNVDPAMHAFSVTTVVGSTHDSPLPPSF